MSVVDDALNAVVIVCIFAVAVSPLLIVWASHRNDRRGGRG